MQDAAGTDRAVETITVRYWAGARAAAGIAEDAFDTEQALTLADLLEQVLQRHPGDRMARTVAACSVLLGDQPVRTQDPAAVVVRPGAVVELLPPFAGG
ncbi:MoaD/ThiS family protein [Nocardioides hwasunensis]|uniref:MoaD/ThiS family protein n=1 Tax=Nocardioides hwasunensis TaxID=397258 RepID=A0ABR8ML94_9ACTN|nr:MoaD/ThiS family protein [Nocardioides hwasunensis]MBD3916793.1 MoaD/ThiS family protein [Nocardioides hwasunensis]